MKDGRARSPRTTLLWWTLRIQWAWGLILLACLTEAPRIALAASAAAFLGGLGLDRYEIQRTEWRRIAGPLVFFILAAAGADLFLGSRDLLSALSVLVLGIQSVKFLLPKKASDGWHLCAISFVEFLASSAVTTEIQFGAFAIVFLGLCAGAMWALQTEQRKEDGEETAILVRPLFAAKLLFFCTGAGIFFTAVLFAASPRIGIGHIMRRLGRAEGITGFSDTISLRDVTGVKVDRRVVARIEFPEAPHPPPSAGLYLRGALYSRFDGNAWSRQDGSQQRVPRIGRQYFVAPPPRGIPLSVADIYLEPMDNPPLLLYGAPSLVEGNLGDVRTDGHGNFSLVSPGIGEFRYRLYFIAEARLPPEETSLSPDLLALPPGGDDLRDLAGRITAGGGSEAERAELVLRYFRSGFRYSLSDPAASVSEFLFVKRAGYCEHYATALSLLLRAAGIPSRVAAGYLGGEWSDVGRYLIVRQSDAHAWTEAWIDGRWATLDATPSLGDRSPFFARTGIVGIYLDWARQRWGKYILGYSLKMQADAAAEAWSALGRARRSAIRNALSPAEMLRRPAFRVILSILAFLYIVVALRKFRGIAPGKEIDGESRRRGSSLPRAYVRLLRRLSSRGYRRSPGTTVEEMVGYATGGRPDLLPPALRFLSLYHRDRFGAFPLSPPEAREAARLAVRLRREIVR